MKELIKYNDRRILISAYNIKTERDLLLSASAVDGNENVIDINDIDEDDLDVFLRLLEKNIESNINIFKLSKSEKLFLLYRLRANSVSNILTINTSCNCGISFKTKIDLNLIANFKELNYPGLKNIYSDDYIDYFIEDPNNLDILKYEEIEEYIIENSTKFNFVKEIKCSNCNENLKIDLRKPSLYRNCFSENSLADFYKSITRLSYSGTISLGSILNDMYPFERDIFIGQINAEIEEENKRTQQTQF